MKILHVLERSAVSRTPRLQIVVVRSVAPVRACPQPLPMKLEDFRWNYPAESVTLDSLYTIVPFTQCAVRMGFEPTPDFRLLAV